MLKRGLMVSLEGADGVGKSVLASAIGAELERKGIRVTLTREPGGTPLAEELRSILLSPVLSPDPITQALMFNAARRDHVQKVIYPALAEPGIVIVDRYLLSTLAYQDNGSSSFFDILMRMHNDTVGLLPDLIMCVDLNTQTIIERIRERGKNEPGGINECSDRAGINARRQSYKSALAKMSKWLADERPDHPGIETSWIMNDQAVAKVAELSINVIHSCAKRLGVDLGS